MIRTKITSGREAQEKILAGVNKMADAVSSTLGPSGRNVAIARSINTGEIYERIVLHDGVSVAKSIVLEDETENMGAALLLEASQKQVDEVGDGTTVVMILAQAIIQECMQLIAAGVDPMKLRKGLELSTRDLVKELEALAAPVKGLKDLKFIATISAEDEELGTLVAETLNKVGKDGVVTAEESKSPDTVVEHQEGMQLDKGWLHSWLVTNPERMEAVLENTYFLITDHPITTLGNLGKFFEAFVKQSKTLVIISPDISGEALPLLVQNKLQGKLMVLCIQAPSFGEDQKGILQDIATLTGGKFYSQEAGYKLENLTPDDLGFAQSIKSTKDETIITAGRGTKKDISSRVDSLRNQLEGETGEFDRERLKARIGKLTNGVAVIRVGGQTEIEMKERRERVLDAVAATRAAMEKGIVPGGETIYLQIRKLFELEDGTLRTNGIADMPANILYRALYKPFKKLITNAGLDEIQMALALHGKAVNFGIDINTGQATDMVKAGIVDPVLVPINALKNAVSVSIQLMTSGYVITPIPEEKK